MTSNFTFLKAEFTGLYEAAREAEKLIHVSPRACCFYARYTLEQMVLWLYENDNYLQLPYDNSLGALIHETTFKDNLKPGLFPKIRLIHQLGNQAAHQTRKIGENDALQLIKELHHLLYWLVRSYSQNGRNIAPQTFDPANISKPETPPKENDTLEKLQQLQTRLSLSEEMQRIGEERRQKSEQELDRLKAEIKALKQKNQTVPDSHDYNEAETRRHLIDLLLAEAGWTLTEAGSKEYEVEGMPNKTGKGRVDYVLWGDDGQPLALVEAKRTAKDATDGQHQAQLYANCLENKFNRRPVIFYTNGYDTYIWDDREYPPRKIQGFLKKDELERLIFRRTHRKKLHLLQPNPDMINRTYQQEAITRIAETFSQKKRKTLLVMATGTGKTRTAIALVDLLQRAGWVNRILFLADRNALVKQAKAAFTRHLPGVSAINLTQDKDADTAKVVLSTYPTIFNRINLCDGGGRIFGPGHFDLILVDEAHRSIYQKYRYLFEYFDGLLVGLTATPRAEVHRDTYGIFDLEPGVPTFAYELDDAVKDGYLVPFRGVKVPFKFLSQGIRFAELSPEEQEDYEEKFIDPDTEEIPPQVDAAALNRWLFNADTVDKALALLMEKGLKVEGGDTLGKTIIFARNHKHAQFIADRFNLSYPHYRGEFAQIIDSHNSYAQSLLDNFSNPEKQPTIAISVDMLDAGVDVPEVLNLVFFKPIYSRVKFNQMIGRGTRLCKDLFAVGEDKTEFFIFDLCGNFEYFSQDIPETDAKLPDTLTSKLVKTRLSLTQAIAELPEPDEDAQNLRQTLLDDLHQHVATMERENILVRRHLQAVEAFSVRDRWNSLNPEDRRTVGEFLAKLPNSRPREDRLAKEFDLLCVKLQYSILTNGNDFVKYRDKIRDILSRLEEKQTIPMVKEQMGLITEAQPENWWTDVTVCMVEYLRVNLRDLVKFIDRNQQNIVYTNYQDELGEVEIVDVPVQQTGFSRYQYRKKVEAYIRENENHIAIAKLKRNTPLTESDLKALEEMLFTSEEIESKEQFEAVFGKQKSLKLFIRELVGLDRNAAKEAFSEYLQGSYFTANPIRFVENIIDYLTQNGVMDPELLYEAPFTDLHHEGLDGVFKNDDADLILSLIRSFNEAADANFDVA